MTKLSEAADLTCYTVAYQTLLWVVFRSVHRASSQTTHDSRISVSQNTCLQAFALVMGLPSCSAHLHFVRPFAYLPACLPNTSRICLPYATQPARPPARSAPTWCSCRICPSALLTRQERSTGLRATRRWVGKEREDTMQC
jgi:hypothetical protein